MMGVYTGGARPGLRGGGIPHKQLETMLARRGVVLAVSEVNTSQKAAMNGRQVRLAEQRDLDGRRPRWRNRVFVVDGVFASDGAHTLKLDRDVSAGLCMVLLGTLKLLRGERAAPWRTPLDAAAAAPPVVVARAAAAAANVRRRVRVAARV
jgi:hypothetical protein